MILIIAVCALILSALLVIMALQVFTWEMLGAIIFAIVVFAQVAAPVLM